MSPSYAGEPRSDHVSWTLLRSHRLNYYTRATAILVARRALDSIYPGAH